MIMRTGKIGENPLKRSVFKPLTSVMNKESRKDAATGEDCAFLADFAVTSDPVTMSGKSAGRLAMIAVVNDLAASGVRIKAVTTVILLPVGSKEETLRDLIKQMEQVASKEQFLVLGGHTEVTDAVVRPVVVATGFGQRPPGTARREGKPGDEIVMSKWAGLEGSYLLSTERQDLLASRFSDAFLAPMREYGEMLSVASEAAVAMKSGVLLMKDVSEGGVFAALWSLSKLTGTGLEVSLPAIPFRQETIEIANTLDFNPYQMFSSGSLLMVTNDSKTLLENLAKEEIPAHVIGVLTEGQDKIIRNEEETRYLELPQPDALLPFLGGAVQDKGVKA